DRDDTLVVPRHLTSHFDLIEEPAGAGQEQHHRLVGDVISAVPRDVGYHDAEASGGGSVDHVDTDRVVGNATTLSQPLQIGRAEPEDVVEHANRFGSEVPPLLDRIDNFESRA